ncbi:ribonuclease HI family protein [archaeon]|nr:MAG: ribonuclease HI family protein [archaeon]
MNTDDIYVYTDGASRGNPGDSASAYCIVRNDTILYEEASYIGVSTNNVAEYTAVILGLEKAKDFTRGPVVVVSDSQLVIFQLRGTWKVKTPHLRPLHEKVRSQATHFSSVTFTHVRRTDPLITHVDALANKKLDDEAEF